MCIIQVARSVVVIKYSVKVIVTFVVVLLPTITIIKYVAMERLPLEVTIFVAAAVTSYMIQIPKCVVVETCYHEGVVNHVVGCYQLLNLTG